MDTDDPVSIPLRDGKRLVLDADVLAIHDGSGTLMIRIAIPDITGISRGGSDLSIIRRHADPIAVTAATVADAHRLLDAMRQQQATASRRPWWRWLRPRRPGA
jgi:hypothetical protein